jgi:drug/metabolite transporter (DMT)-like permease
MGVLLSLGASVGWGGSDFLGGLMSRRASLPTVLGGSQLAGLLLFAPVLLVQGTPVPSDGRVLLGGLAGVVAVAELGMIYLALKRGPVVLIAPVAALGVALPIVVGIAGGDRIDLALAAGLACAIAGAVAVSWAPGEDESSAPTLTAIGLAGGSAVGAGLVLVLIDAVSETSIWWGIGAMRVGGVLAVVVMLAALALVRHPRPSAAVFWCGMRNKRLPPGARWPALASLRDLPRSLVLLIAAIGAADVAADVSYAGATRNGALSIVAVIASLYPVTAIALGAVVLRERPGSVQLAGAVLACAGIVMLSAATAG